MRKQLITPLLIAAMLLITACSQNTPQSRPLYSGSRGVELSFPEQNNFQMYEGDKFSIAIRMENDGAYSINDSSNLGYITAVYDASVLSLDYAQSSYANTGGRFGDAASQIPFTLEGRSLLSPVSGVDYAEFTFDVQELPLNREQLRTPVTFQACYPYVTTFIKNVCVDRDFYTQKNTPVCISNTVTDQNQGAPVAVTSVEPRFTRVEQGVQPRFKITITNLDDGYVAYDEKQTAKELCSLDNFNKSSWGKVAVDARLGSIKLDCGVTGNVTRFEGRTADIVCGVPTGDPSLQTLFSTGANYEAPLTVQLHYFYISSITAQVEVERP